METTNGGSQREFDHSRPRDSSGRDTWPNDRDRCDEESRARGSARLVAEAPAIDFRARKTGSRLRDALKKLWPWSKPAAAPVEDATDLAGGIHEMAKATNLWFEREVVVLERDALLTRRRLGRQRAAATRRRANRAARGRTVSRRSVRRDVSSMDRSRSRDDARPHRARSRVDRRQARRAAGVDDADRAARRRRSLESIAESRSCDWKQRRPRRESDSIRSFRAGCSSGSSPSR